MSEQYIPEASVLKLEHLVYWGTSKEIMLKTHHRAGHA